MLRGGCPVAKQFSTCHTLHPHVRGPMSDTEIKKKTTTTVKEGRRERRFDGWTMAHITAHGWSASRVLPASLRRMGGARHGAASYPSLTHLPTPPCGTSLARYEKSPRSARSSASRDARYCHAARNIHRQSRAGNNDLHLHTWHQSRRPTVPRNRKRTQTTHSTDLAVFLRRDAQDYACLVKILRKCGGHPRFQGDRSDKPMPRD